MTNLYFGLLLHFVGDYLLQNDWLATKKTKSDMDRHIVCLCGSTIFKEAFENANKNFTSSGAIVLSVGWFAHCDSEPLSEEQKKELDELHLDKIRMADDVIFLNVGGYLGESSLRELKFCVENNKIVWMLNPDKVPLEARRILDGYMYYASRYDHNVYPPKLRGN